MVVGAFPIAKLGTLFIKQISKPLANKIVQGAVASPIFRKYVCMPPAQFYNWCEVKTKMWVLNLGKPVNIPVLSEQMAIELGANLLGEGIIFTIAAGLLLAEYSRGVRKEAAKEEARRLELEEFNNKIQELYCEVQKQSTEMKELLRCIYDLESRVVQKPWKLKPSKSEPAGLSESRFEQLPDGNSSLTPKNIVYTHNEGLILQALDYVERDLLLSEDEPKDIGILVLGLEYLHCNNVLRLS